MLVAPRLRSLKRCAPNSARRLMWSGLRLFHGFSDGSVAVACCLRKRSHGVSSETSVASYIWTATPKNSAKLYCINEYSFALQVSGPHSPLFFATSVFEPSAFTRMTLLDRHHCSWKAALIIWS